MFVVLLFPPSQKLLHSVQPPLSPLWRCTKTKQDSNSDQNKKNKTQKQKQALDISPVPSVPRPGPPPPPPPTEHHQLFQAQSRRPALLRQARCFSHPPATQSRYNPSCHHCIHANRQTHTCVSPPSPLRPPLHHLHPEASAASWPLSHLSKRNQRLFILEGDLHCKHWLLEQSPRNTLAFQTSSEVEPAHRNPSS